MTFEQLIRSEHETALAFSAEYALWEQSSPNLSNALFEVAAFTGSASEIESPAGYYHTFAQQTYLRVPYSFRATTVLLSKGYYGEAISIVRHLYEALVQSRYFQAHNDLVKSHVLAKRIQFRIMFDEISPGFYSEYYTRQLSEFAHPGLGATMFRGTMTSPQKVSPIMGNKYFPFGASYVVMHLNVLLYGFLNCAPLLFLQYSSLASKPVERKRIECIDWLQVVIDRHRQVNPKSSSFYDLVRPMIKPGEGAP